MITAEEARNNCYSGNDQVQAILYNLNNSITHSSLDGKTSLEVCFYFANTPLQNIWKVRDALTIAGYDVFVYCKLCDHAERVYRMRISWELEHYITT